MGLWKKGRSGSGSARWSYVFGLFLLIVSLGCGGGVIDPGPVSSRRSPRISQLDSRSTLPPTVVEQVPASQVIDLPHREEAVKYHEVKPGETLTGIAGGHGVTLERLLDANGFDNSTTLQPGELIYIPSL